MTKVCAEYLQNGRTQESKRRKKVLPALGEARIHGYRNFREEVPNFSAGRLRRLSVSC